MKPAVKIERLGKRYRVGGLHPGYMTFREALAGVVAAPFKTRRRGEKNGLDARGAFWALEDVNLEVGHGELVGVVGRNGAGKSTLLKILSRVTRPTRGRVEIYGRVGSLLEVGTGFHPDLTGRENVFLSGAILGMRRFEIERKFDEIVAFSEIEKFIDTPVKWYSSGMYVRLAFSVAAHLEPEILMMDEVLAVGDAAFQQKCLDKMHDIRGQGRTIFFVSHNMPAVTRLCKRVVWLDAGRVVGDGPAQQVVNDYLSASWNVGAERAWADDAPGNEVVRLRSARVVGEDGLTHAAFDIRRPVGVELTYEVFQPGRLLTPHVELHNDEGVHLFSAHDAGDEWRRVPRPEGVYASTVWIPGNLLAEGNVLVHVSVMSHAPSTVLHAQERYAVAFQVVDTQEGDSARGDYVGPITGAVRPLLRWTTKAVNSES
ncbi:MAG TPA: ABC transporter ATP-binding protein [Pyrinomonadaceae bacterium]|nr:ABC transporter ATP-binding protein [Pyrinomonadaceae bacterium]